MRILQVTNYPAWIKVSTGEQPSHHLWGMHEYVAHYECHGNSYRGYLKNGEGYVDFLQVTNMSFCARIFYIIRLYVLCFKYDIVFDSLCCVTKYLGILFRIYRPCRLVSILHHPPFDKILKYTRADAYIFFDEKYKLMAEKTAPAQKNKYYAIKWQPDTHWYATMKEKIGAQKKEYMFIDNGKTFRDHELMTSTIYRLWGGTKAVLINKQSFIPQNYIEGKNLKYIELESPDDIFLLTYLMRSKCILIPAKAKGNNRLLGPIGATSFMDAIALGMPIVCSDNLYFSEDVDKYELGVTYKAGDEDALLLALKKISENDDFFNKCIANMGKYAQGKDISHYGNQIMKIFHLI